MKRIKQNYLHKPTFKMHQDAGLALILILLLIGYFTHRHDYFYWAIPIVLITMTMPSLLAPFTLLWFGISRILGTIMSTLILSLIFFLMVSPVGIIRRFLGFDSLKLKEFGRSKESVMHVRNHDFTARDMENLF